MNHPPTLAIVVPCFNEEAVIPKTHGRLKDCLSRLVGANVIARASFICFIDDGSVDDTWKLVKGYASSPNVKALKLSRNFGHQNALLAGLLRVRNHCDCAISIDADLQQDEAAIADFVEQFVAGSDIVLGVRKDRRTDGPVKRATAELLYRFMAFLGVAIVRNHADYRLMSRRTLDALAQFDEENVFLRGLILQLGFKKSIVYFDVRERAEGESKYTFRKMCSLAFSGVTSFSVAPLRLIAVIGSVFTVLSMVMAAYVVIRRLVYMDAVPGWASIVLPIYLLGGIQLFAIGVIGEYIGRIYIEAKRRPRFIIEEDLIG